MTAGRPRKPLERRALESKGDGQAVSHGQSAPSAELVPRESAQFPVCPDDLGDRGEVEWLKVWSAGWWLNEEQDYHWVLTLSKAYDDMQAFREQVEHDGLVVTGYAGQMTAHPLIKEIRDCERQIMKCLSTLGFSPSDRARLGIQAVKQQNELQKLQNARRQNREQS